MTLCRYRATDDRRATVRGVHEGLPEHGVYHGCSVAQQPSRGRGCVPGGFPEGLRTLRRAEREPDDRRLAQNGDTKPLFESPVALPGTLAVLFGDVAGPRQRGSVGAGVGRAGYARARGGDSRPPATAGSGVAEAASGAACAPGAVSLRRDELRRNRREAPCFAEQGENGHPSGTRGVAAEAEVEAGRRRGMGWTAWSGESLPDVNRI